MSEEIDCQACVENVSEVPQYESDSVVVDDAEKKSETESTKRVIRVNGPKTPKERTEKQREAFLRCQEARKKRLADILEQKANGTYVPKKRVKKSSRSDSEVASTLSPPSSGIDASVLKDMLKEEMSKVQEEVSKPVRELLETVRRTSTSVRVKAEKMEKEGGDEDILESPAAVLQEEEEKRKNAVVKASQVLPTSVNNRASRRDQYYSMMRNIVDGGRKTNTIV